MIKKASKVIMIVFGLILGLSFAIFGDVNVKREGTDKVILENKYIRLSIDASQGGIITEFIEKSSGKDLTVFKRLGGKEGVTDGMLCDKDWSQAYKGDWYREPYSLKINHKGGEKGSVILQAQGKAKFPFVVISKEIILYKDKRLVEINYQVHNMPEALGALYFRPWFHNEIGILGEKGTYFVPTTLGIQRIKFPPHKRAEHNRWFYNPSFGWSGYLSESGTGVVAVMDYKYLKCFYNWIGRNICTLEWRYNPIPIEEGGTFTTTFYFVPFTGLAGINGASRYGVGTIQIEDKTIKVSAVSSEELGMCKLYLRYKKLPQKEYKLIKEIEFPMMIEKVSEKKITFTPSTEGTFEIEALIKRDNKEILKLKEPLIIGEEKIAYKMEPEEKRIGVEKEEGPVPFKLSEEIVTPHYRWAKPYKKGKTSVLIISRVDGGIREVVELSQRMDIDYHVPTLYPRRKWHDRGWYPPPIPTTYHPELKRVFAQLKEYLSTDYEAIVISSGKGKAPCRKWITWDMLGKASKEKIINQVKKGTGLVYINPLGLSGVMKEIFSRAKGIESSHYIYKNIPFDILPTRINPSDIKITTYGKGRIIFLIYSTRMALTPKVDWDDYFSTHFPYWEYYHSLLIKSILWAARKEPVDEKIEKIKISPPKVKVCLNNARGLKLNIKIYDPYGEEVYKKELRVNNDEVGLLIPQNLKQGIHILNVWLKERGKIVDWGSKSIKVKIPVKIASIKLDKEIYSVGDTIKTRLNLVNSSGEEKSIRLKVKSEDGYGRLTQEVDREVTVSSSEKRKEIEISVKPNSYLTTYNKITFTLQEKDKVLQKEIKEFWVRTGKGWDDFPCILWSWCWSPLYIVDYMAKQVKRLGFTAVYTSAGYYGGKDGELYARNNLKISPLNFYRFYIWGDINKIALQTHPVREPCLSDPAFLKKLKDRIQKYTEYNLKLDPFLYIVADENSLTRYGRHIDVCFSPHCLKKFREYLKQEYKSLKELNKKWATSFTSWDEVMPMTEEEVKGRGNYAPWAEHRRFMNRVYANANQLVRETMEKIDKSKPFYYGPSGTQPPGVHNGYDWWELMKVYNHVTLYGEGTMQKSFRPDGRFSSFLGYRQSYVYEEDYIWKLFLGGHSAISFWFQPYFILPDLRYSPYYSPVITNIMNPLTKGIGKLRLKAKMQYDPIAIYYSHRSLEAAYILRNESKVNTFKLFNQSFGDGGGRKEGAILRLLRDAGFTPHYLAPEQLLNGIPEERGIKVIYLPVTIALSDEEISKLMEFVENGGVIIADLMTGLMDECLTYRKEEKLSKFLGIKGGKGNLLQGNFKFSSSRYRGLEFSVGVIGDIKLSSGKALGNAFLPAERIGGIQLRSSDKRRYPVLIENRFGKGRVYTLNFISDYFNLANVGKGKNQLALLKKMLKDIGITPIKFKVVSGNKEEAVRIYRYKLGNTYLIGFIKDIYSHPKISSSPSPGPGVEWIQEMTVKDRDKYTKPVKIEFPWKAHIYDVRTKEYYGYTDKIDTTLTPGVGKLYALLPFQVKNLKIETDKKVYHPGDEVKYEIKSGSLNSVIRIEVIGPEGRIKDCYSRNLLCKDGKTKGKFILGLNARAGNYKIRIKEVISGKEKEIVFKVKSKQKGGKL